MGLVNTGASLGGLAGGANVARLMVVISGSSAGLSSALAAATADVQGFGNKLTGLKQNSGAIGSALIRGISLPAMAVGGAAIKMAMDYEAAMARVAGLTTLTGSQVEKAYDGILEMSTRVPTAPVDLAESLYYAGSAGLKFGEAMQVVEASAQAAAIGMGEAEDISKILIFALNNYRDEGLTTARAMDVFTAAIKEGTAAPDELAIALGRVLPVAKEVGVSFDTTVASVAALTNLGLPTRVAATSLRALFGGLLAPTKQATEALSEFGITTDQLRDAVDAGPLVAFGMLEDAVGGNEDMMRKIIPQIRAFTAYLGLSGEQAKRAADVYNDVRNSAGAFDKAVSRIETSKQFQFALALNKMREAGIQLGTALFPVFDRLVSIIGTFGGVLGSLGELGTSAVAALVAMAAAIGPLVKLYAVLSNQGAGMATSLKSMGAGALTATAGWLVLAGTMKQVEKNGVTLGTGLMIAVSGFAAMGLTMNVAAAALTRYSAAAGVSAAASARAATAATVLQSAWLPFAAIVAAGAVAVAIFRSKAQETERQVRDLGKAFQDLGADTLLSKQAFRDLSTSLDGVQLDIFRDAVEQAGATGETFATNIGDIINQVEQEISRLESVTSDGGGSVVDLFRLDEAENQLSALKDQREVFKQQAEDQIALYGQEGQAYDRLATKYGVSSEFIRENVSKVGVGVTELSGDVEQAWAEQVGFVDKSTGKIVAAQREMQAQEEKITAERIEALRGNMLGTFFEKDVAKVKASTAKLVANTTKQTQAYVQMAADVNSLRIRGLDPGALQFLVDQGPAMVAKFADASGAELKTFENNYYKSLGAVDAAILNEGDHQEAKGNKIVGQFASGMLSNRALPVAATTRIVGEVTDAFARGKINEQGVAFIGKFADRMEAMKGIPKAAAVRIMDGVIQAIRSRSLVGAGASEILEFAQGIARSSGAPKENTEQIVDQIVRVLTTIPGNDMGYKVGSGFAQGLTAAESRARAAALGIAGATRGILSGIDGYGPGWQVGQQFAAGLNAAEHTINQAIAGVAQGAKKGAEKDFRDSPKYFTYYLGQRLVKQMDEGIRSINTRGTINRPSVSLPSPDKNGTLAGSGSQVIQNFHGDRFTPKEAMRELRWHELTKVT